MNSKTFANRWTLLSVSAAGAVWLAGCATDKQPTGHIYINQPAVFTRERLVDKRLKDLQWLEAKLNNVPASTLQGARSQSQFSSFSGQLTAQFDPLAAAGATGNLETLQSAQQAAQLQNKVVTTALQQKLQDLQSGNLSYSNVLGSNSLTASNLQGSNATFGANLPIVSNPAAPASSLPSASNIVLIPTNTIQLTATEQFQDQLAYRDAVSAEMQERQLDDTHDRVGMTLYTLKFDLSVLPGKKNHSLGQADLTLMPPCINTDAKQKGAAAIAGGESSKDGKACSADEVDQYKKWAQALRRNFDTEVISIQRRFLQGYLTDEEERQLIVRSWKVRDEAPARIQRLVSQILASLPDISAVANNASLTPNDVKNIQPDLAALYDEVKQLPWDDETLRTKLATLTSKVGDWLENVRKAQLNKINKADHPPELKVTTPLGTSYNRQKITGKIQMIEREQNAVKAFANLVPAFKSWHDSPISSNVNMDKIMMALGYLTAAEYSEAMECGDNGSLVTIGNARQVSTVSNDFHYLVTVESNTNETRAFLDRTEELQKKAKKFPYVYAAGPKESAQNLSDSSAAQSAMNLSASLAAAIPQIGTSLGTALNYMKQNQYLLEMIKREPLLVSYMRGQTNFGWILGPRFKIRKDLTLGYEQIPVQESVEATIGVPAWWLWVKIAVTNSWLGKDGEPQTKPETNCFMVRLRPDMDALVQAFLEDTDPVTFGRPQINPQWNGSSTKWRYVVQSGGPAQLLILGRNLWRNPRIFIGSQGTSSEYDYTILPDMQGLVAQFTNVQPVAVEPGADAHSPKVDLRVITSDGEAVLKDAVAVLSGTASNAAGGGPKTFASLQKNWFVAGQSLTLTVNTNALPSGYAGFELYLGTPVAPKKMKQVSKAKGPDKGQLVFTPTPSGGAWNNPAEVSIDVRMRATPSAKPASVLTGGEQNVVVFGTVAQSQFVYVNTDIILPKAAGSQAVVQVKEPGSAKLFWEAWLGMDGGTAVLQLTTAGGARLTLGADANSTPIVMKQSDVTHDFYLDGTLAKKVGVANAGDAAPCAGVLIVTPASGAAPLQITVAGTVTVKLN